MESKKILFVVGARPNFIKLAPLCYLLTEEVGICYEIVHTGQHYDEKMSQVFFEELGITPPTHHLGVGSGTHGEQTAKIMLQFEQICIGADYDGVVVIGDVNSTLAAALVACKLHLPVFHVEAGLRSFNRQMPEEINRIMADHVSDLLFAPTAIAMANLAREGLSERAILSGDVMYDMILRGLEMARERSNALEHLQLSAGQYYLATLHRPYNVDDPHQLGEIMTGLGSLDAPVVLSAHPRLRKMLDQSGIALPSSVTILAPQGYLDFVWLQHHARRVVTDSGGVQKEAFFLRTPCITLRSETEWAETIEAGANRLVPERTSEHIVEAVMADMVPDFDGYPYGHGNASEIIIEHIRDFVID